MQQPQWEQTNEGQTFDFRITHKEDGTIQLQGLKDSSYRQEFESTEELSQYFQNLDPQGATS